MLGSKRTKTLLVFVIVVGFQLANSILVGADSFHVTEPLSKNNWRGIWVPKNVYPSHFPKYLKSAGSKHQFFAGYRVQWPEIKDRIQPRFGTSCDNVGPAANDWGFKLRENWLSVYKICHAEDDTKLYLGAHILSRRLAAVHDIKAAECPHLANVVAPADTSQIGFDLLLPNFALDAIGFLSRVRRGIGGIGGPSGFAERVSKQPDSPYADASGGDRKQGHYPLGSTIAPKIELISAGYRFRDICLLILGYLAGSWLSYLAIGWITKPSDEGDKNERR